MEYKMISENFDLFEYCEELETAAENKVKFPLIAEIRQILKDLKVKQKAVDFAKFALDDLIKFRDRLYAKMQKLLSVNFVFKRKEEDTFSLTDLNPDTCFFTDQVEYEDFNFEGYKICKNEYEPRPFSNKDFTYSNKEELDWCLKLKEHAESSEYIPNRKQVRNGCTNVKVNHGFSRKNLLYVHSKLDDVCDDIKPHLIKIYDDGIIKFCNKNNLIYLLTNGHIDLRLTDDMMNYLSKFQILELNDYYGTDSDPYPLGFCWLNLFDESCHEFLIENYSPFLTATEIYRIIQRHPNSINLLSLDHIVYYRIVDGFGHFSFEPYDGVTRYEYSSNAYELLSVLYTMENNFKDKYEAEEAKLKSMFNLIKCTEGFHDCYFSSDYFTFNLNRDEIFVFGDICHKIVLRYFKL
jgi:hypothetical protein